MPKVRALGSFRMQLESAAKHAMENEKSRTQELSRELEKMKSSIGVMNGKKITDADFAEIIGMTPRHYRTIKKNPMKLTVNEILAIRAVSVQIGEPVHAGIKE